MNAYAPSRRVGIDITFRLIDTQAAADAAPSSSGGEAFSDLALLLPGTAQSPGKVMTMEDGLVVTDGTWSPMPDNAVVPWWSTALSDENGQFDTPPTLTMALSSPYRLPKRRRAREKGLMNISTMVRGSSMLRKDFR